MKKIPLLFTALSLSFSVNAQDALFLNTNQSLVYLNPSFAGSNGHVRDQASYRNQWPDFSGRLVTYLNTFDAYIKPLNTGVAVSVFSDDQARGTLKTQGLSLAYAQYFSFLEGNLKIIPSFQITYGTRRLDKGNLHLGDLIDLRNGTVWNTPMVIPVGQKEYLDANAGLLIKYKDLYLGASIFHMNQPDIGLLGTYKLPALVSLNASYNKTLSEKVLLNFSGRVFHQTSTNIQGAVNLVYDHLLVGIGYRSMTGFVNAGFRTKFFTCVLGYERYTYEKHFLDEGAWELMLSFNVRKETPKGNITSPEEW